MQTKQGNLWRSLVALAMILAPGAGGAAWTQKASAAPAQTAPALPAQKPPSSAPPPQETQITPAQARELFADVGQILQFASTDTKFPIKHDVKSRLISRADVEKYLLSKMNDDKDAKRMEREEIVLKKFGLIDSDFQLRPFLVKLLDEQIAAYYDSRTKTVNLLNWIAPDQQKPVLAHELTHALQDQDVNLDKWESPGSDNISRTFKQDQRHVATDEDDTARQAVIEGQAMAVFVDYSLAPFGRSLRNSPQLIDVLLEQMTGNNSARDPVLARAPLLLQESLLFPYKYGLKFEADLIADEKDPSAPFAGVLARPPASSYEIMNPEAYERHVKVPVLTMPDIHPIIDANYNPYDIGVMGELDVKILSELYGGPQAANEFTPAWDGGIYYAAQRRDAPDKDSTSSVALFYLSQWTSPSVAADFAKMYAAELGQQYTQVTRDTQDESDPSEQIYQTSQGPVLIATTGNDVFVSESFPLNTARKLEFFMVSAQQQGSAQIASDSGYDPLRWVPAAPYFGTGSGVPRSDLTGNLVRFMASCGLMKAALIR
ncbi:MAG TPA: hypothetical protein VME18_03615 [Acidobacteriaceae bacterium]|nr:hypothetical protein [Acidobacteriaceae bacterium]